MELRSLRDDDAAAGANPGAPADETVELMRAVEVAETEVFSGQGGTRSRAASRATDDAAGHPRIRAGSLFEQIHAASGVDQPESQRRGFPSSAKSAKMLGRSKAQGVHVELEDVEEQMEGGYSEQCMLQPEYYKSELQLDPFKTTTIFWKRVLAVGFFAVEFMFFPNYHDMMPEGERTTPFEGFGETKPYCGWENEWFLQSASLRVENANLCMRNWAAFVLLSISHTSGVVLYMSLSIVMLTRFRYTLSMLQCTQIGEWIPFQAMPEIHKDAGLLTCHAVFWHGLTHVLRFAANGDLSAFYCNAAISGYVSAAIMFLISGGMTRALLLKLSGANWIMWNRSWETKYVVHMMWSFFSIAMFYHRHRFGVFWVVALILFALDRACERYYGTFRALDMELMPCGTSGTMLRFAYQTDTNALANKGVEVAGSIVRICMPMISKHQYHPFSAMYDPYDARFACVYIAKVGDWTTELYNYSLCHRRMPWAWVAGPLFSEFQSALQFRDIVLVCSGAAITPVLGLSQYFDPKVHRVTLIWLSRDAELISFLLPICNPATKIVVYYTGKDKAREKIAALKTQKFFAAPQLSAKQQMKVQQQRSMQDSTEPNRAEKLEVQFGRPKDWDTILDEHIAPNMRGETCVAISSGVKRLSAEVEQLCKKKGIARIRSDASFG